MLVQETDGKKDKLILLRILGKVNILFIWSLFFWNPVGFGVHCDEQSN